MKIEVRRNFFLPTCTLGELLVDGDHFGYTLEDRVRPAGEKVKGETAIPAGDYRVEIQPSPSFGRPMPYIKNVPMFDRIMIHWGNTIADTQGCIIIGKILDTEKEMVLDSRVAFNALYPKIEAAIQRGEEVTVAISGAP